jgi:transposase-like protein
MKSNTSHGADADVTVAPTACPFCGSSAITTASEHADASSYWRCVGCGELWNVDRLRASSAQSYNGRWRRPSW